MKITLVILTYNEIEGIKNIFPKISQNEVDEIITIDGGSNDGTVEYLKKKNIKVFSQKIKGRGEAFREAFRQAKGDALIFFSPDGNENPLDIPKFKKYLLKDNDMVIATRMTKNAHNEEDEQVFKWRKWANNAFNLMANLTWNRSPFITDTINGFRAIKKSTWEKIKLDGNGYTIEYQSSIRCFKLGLKIEEFPTFEGSRIDDKIGSPSIQTGIIFLKLYFNELIRRKKF